MSVIRELRKTIDDIESRKEELYNNFDNLRSDDECFQETYEMIVVELKRLNEEQQKKQNELAYMLSRRVRIEL